MKTLEIQAIEKKYGIPLFRMAFAHLMDVGYRNMSNSELVSECFKNIRATTNPDSILSADFQCSLIECAAELTKFSIDDLLHYSGEENKWKGYLCDLVYALIEEKGSEEAFDFVEEACGASSDELREIGIEAY